MTNLVKDIKKLIAGQCSQALLHIASEFVRFLKASIGAWDDGDFGATRFTSSKDDLRCEPGT